MRLFFFATMQENCDIDCRWQTCPQRYLASLLNVDGLRQVEILGGTPACFTELPGKSPKTGDLAIFYLKDSHDLDAMLRIREKFDGVKKILVIADPTGGDDRKYHLLEPRYITQAGRSITELEAVIHKMAESVH